VAFIFSAPLEKNARGGSALIRRSSAVPCWVGLEDSPSAGAEFGWYMIPGQFTGRRFKGSDSRAVGNLGLFATRSISDGVRSRVNLV